LDVSHFTAIGSMFVEAANALRTIALSILSAEFQQR
jgi:hypothetical protein